jgi:hypothetical protein
MNTVATYNEFFNYIKERNQNALDWTGIDVIYLSVSNRYLDCPTAAQVLVNGEVAFTVPAAKWDQPMEAHNLCTLAHVAFTRGYELGYSKAQMEESAE